MGRSHLVTAAGGATFLCGILAAGMGNPLIAVLAGVLAVATAALAHRAILAAEEGPFDAEATPTVTGDARAIADPESGLFGADFFQATLEGRVATARRVLRPLSVVLFAVEEGDPAGPTVPLPPNLVASSLDVTLRESDVACRLGGSYGVLLEDTGEDGAVWTAERIRRNLASTGRDRLFRAGVASYPTHGLSADELIERADAALRLARDWHRDRIEVAPSA